MKFFSMLVLLSLTVFVLSGCPGNATNGNAVNSNTRVAVNSNANAANSDAINFNTDTSSSTTPDAVGEAASPKDFMTEAAQGGMAEVELGKLASTRGQSAEVKQFGQKMVTEHTRANEELKALAAKKNMTLPAAVSNDQKEDIDELSKLSGAEFDKEYVRMMVEDHQKDVNSFRAQSQNVTD